MVTEARKRRQHAALSGNSVDATTLNKTDVVKASECVKDGSQPGKHGSKQGSKVKQGKSKSPSVKGKKGKIADSKTAQQGDETEQNGFHVEEQETMLADGRLARYQKRYRHFPSDCVPGKEWTTIAIGSANKLAKSAQREHPADGEKQELNGVVKKRRKEFDSSTIYANNVESFCEKLVEGAVGMDAIRHFIQKAGRNADHVDEYLRAGGTLQPLVDMLASACEKETLTDIADMLHIIHYVLIKALVFDETQKMDAIDCAEYLMTDCQPVIVRLLREKDDPAQAFKASAFRILKAIMLVDSQAYGRNVLKLMDVCMPELEMHKCRETIVKQDGVVQVSLRTVFIEFNLTFLIDTSPEVVRLWLTRPHLINPLIQNLVYDNVENVILLMRSLRQYVLDCANIDKYIYRTVFTTDLLKALVNTYEWVGPERAVPTEEKQKSVLNATEEVVLPLLTSKRFFLVPKAIDLDRASPRHKHILLALKNSQLHAHQRRLVLRLFETCPEVLPAVLENYGGLLKTKLADNRELLISILKLLKPEDVVAGLDTGVVTAKALSNFVVKSTLPRTVLEYVGVAMGKRENIAFCLEILAIMISRCEQYLQLIERARTVDQFGMKKLKFDAINQILGLFPSVDRIMTALEQHRNDRSVKKTNVAMEYAMDILLVCIRSFRAYIDSSAFITNFKNILKPGYRTQAHEMYFLNYELKAIKVVIALEPQSVSFNSPQFLSVLTLMAKIYLNADPAMREEATELLLALFRNTTLFGNRTTEIEFWFQALFDLPQRSSVPELVVYLGKSAREAAQNISKQSTTSADHSLIDEAFEKVGERNDDLEELFARIEQEDVEGDEGQTAVTADIPLELPVTDNFFLYMFARDRKHPEKFARYFDGVMLRYLHYLPHPEIVEKALPIGSTSVTSEYVRGWMSGKECVLDKDGGWGVLGALSKALVEKKPKMTLFPTNLELKEQKKNFRPKLVHMLHITLFHLSRLIVAKTLTQQHLDVIAHYTDVLLTAMLKEGSGFTDTDFGEVLAGLFLQRPALFEHFTITTKQENVDESTGAIRRLVTGFVYELMQKLSHLPNFDRYTTLYSNKIVSELINSSTKELVTPGSTTFDSGLVEKLRAIFNLNERHCVTLLRHYAKLPVEAFFGSQEATGNVRTFHYNQLCFALERLSSGGSGEVGSNREHLTEKIVRGLVRIYMECGRRLGNDPLGLDDFERALLAYFSTFTHSIAHVEPELMGVFFENRQRIGKPLVVLATFLLARDARFNAPFQALVGPHSAKKELVYPLLNVAFQRSIFSADSDEGKRLLMKLYGEFKGGIQKMLEKPHKAAVIYRENTIANESLVRLCMPRNECVDFARKKLRIEAVEVFQLRVLMEIYGNALEAVRDDHKQQAVVYGNGFAVLLQCFEVLVRSSSSAVHFLKRAEAVPYLNELVLALFGWSQRAKHSKTLREMSFEGVTSSANWNTFCKTCLKFGIDMPQYEDNARRYDDRLHVLPKIMAVLVDLFYANDNREQTDIERYYDWALSHSLFLRVLLTQFHFKPKTSLVHLLYVLARKNPTVANRKHIPLFLGAYGATLSDCNRYILALLQVYERAGLQTHQFRPFLWGETAIKHFSLQADANEAAAPDESSQCRRTSFFANPAEVFSLLTKDKVNATILQFPVWRRLDACAQLPLVDFDDIGAQADADGEARHFSYQPTGAVEEFVEKQHRRRKHEKAPPAELLEMRATKPEQCTAMYDPAFLVPMLGYLFAPEQEDMLNLAGRAGVIGLPFVCLASNDEQMRLAAGCVITRIRGHLEQTTKFIDARFWLHLFSAVQNGLSAMTGQAAKRGQKVAVQLPKAPFLSTIFITQTIAVLPDVLNDLHGPMTRYIMQKEVVDFRAIPNFMSLFHSADVKHGVHRLFVLNTIYRGIQTHEDFELLRASPIIRAMMHFYASPLSNRELNITILNMLNAITKIPKSCVALMNTVGFLAWLSQRIDAIESFHFDTIQAFLGILSNCWYSMHAVAIANAAANSSRGQHQPQHGRVPVTFHRSVLVVTLKFLPLLSTRSSSKTLIRFLNLLEKTTSARFSNERLLALVSEPALEQMLEYFEKLFGAHLWCVQYVRQCGTHSCDDDVTTGRKLRDSSVDPMTLSIVLSLRRFVIRWHNFQKGVASAWDAVDTAEDELLEVQTELEINTEHENAAMEVDQNE
uniref:Nucleolar pre-ribosomal-associated protein 1 N-terminal domain-containing protein n=1 Tax=Anopheles atroparvus TaxID=41427 RepID=A0AAG5DVZ6_ANOAO